MRSALLAAVLASAVVSAHAFCVTSTLPRSSMAAALNKRTPALLAPTMRSSAAIGGIGQRVGAGRGLVSARMSSAPGEQRVGRDVLVVAGGEENFVGRLLVEKLLKEGESVSVISDNPDFVAGLGAGPQIPSAPTPPGFLLGIFPIAPNPPLVRTALPPCDLDAFTSPVPRSRAPLHESPPTAF